MCEKKDLVDILDDLRKADFDTFKWHLKQETWNGKGPIKESKLEDAKILAVVDLMVQMFELPGAVEVMVNILKKINRNDLVKKLEDLSPAAAVKKDESKPSAGARNKGEEFSDPEEKLFKVRPEFVDRVSEEILIQLLDGLEADGVFNCSEKEGMLQKNQTRANKARETINAVMKKGQISCRLMIKHLHLIDPTLSNQLGLSSN
ncbi:uncharacterized protein LOC106939894 [Poecilia latipinna]|uniref:uncharacterized protein LOC106939894 n=1 Tax=Poecilia latipinna TaxID=48699 RepID=UPI00072E5414|nr:PREDICTED: uncharacterized protein LOC106939894 [Poecilia latipinna]